MSREIVVVIPARMGGSRLPGKPLIEIDGKPMLLHVWERCVQIFSDKDVFVATEDREILEFCQDRQIQCVLTGKAESAIDRIYLFSKRIDSNVYLNVQGDEPIINPADIKKIAEYATRFPNRVVFGKAPASYEDFMDISKAKVVCDLEGKLLYSSRTGIPVGKDGKFYSAERAIWVYAFPKSSLERYSKAAGLSKLDKIEDNEILRFLEAGEPVYCIDLEGDSWAVDEMKDIEIVEAKIRARKTKSN
jgi:3-deoxy-manno-octulosonate cytidylyltransferase (CMP-KDO synthetase)